MSEIKLLLFLFLPNPKYSGEVGSLRGMDEENCQTSIRFFFFFNTFQVAVFDNLATASLNKLIAEQRKLHMDQVLI